MRHRCIVCVLYVQALSQPTHLQIMPSKRTPQNWISSPNTVDVCMGSQWDPDHIVTCGWVDSSGSVYAGGLCDPNGHCYYTRVSYQVRRCRCAVAMRASTYFTQPQSVAKDIEQILSIFTSHPSISDFHAFDKCGRVRTDVPLHHAPQHPAYTTFKPCPPLARGR